MTDPIKSYYLRLTSEMSRELRHRSIESGKTMNAEIITAIRLYLDSMKPSEAQATDGSEA
jgi:hypothetical protein